MTRDSDRRPSTLAANRAIAATRPIPIPPAKKPGDPKPSVQTVSREPAPKPVATSRQAVPGTKSTGKSKPTGAGEQRIVFTVIVCFLVCVATLVAVRVGDNMQASEAKVAIGNTFKVVHQQQQNFRVLNSRFATWPELEAAGATLPPTQRVAASNADASHWYLSLRDQQTGVVCDRTGELFDESATERKPVCRSK